MKKLMIFMVIILMSVSVYADDQDTTTQREIRQLVKDYLGGVSSSSMWPDPLIDRLVNLAQREYALLVGISKKDTIVTTTGTKEYALNSDFLRIRGASIYNVEGDKRERALLYRSPRSMGSQVKAYGEDDDQDHPMFYTISGGELNEGKYLIIDPPEEEDDRDTLIIYYYAQAIELGRVAADTITNVPYEGIPMVVYSAVRGCLIRNREYPALPFLDKAYEVNRILLIEEQSDMEYRMENP